MTEIGMTEVRTRAVIFDDEGKLLLQYHPVERFYRLPGGGLEGGETLVGCVEREIKEETGLLVEVGRLLWVRDFLSDENDYSIEVFFLAEIVGGDFGGKGPEGFEFSFVTMEDLGELVFYPKALVQSLMALRDNRGSRELDVYVGSIN